jgi:hypothetical protein
VGVIMIFGGGFVIYIGMYRHALQFAVRPIRVISVDYMPWQPGLFDILKLPESIVVCSSRVV